MNARTQLGTRRRSRGPWLSDVPGPRNTFSRRPRSRLPIVPRHLYLARTLKAERQDRLRYGSLTGQRKPREDPRGYPSPLNKDGWYLDENPEAVVIDPNSGHPHILGDLAGQIFGTSSLDLECYKFPVSHGEDVDHPCTQSRPAPRLLVNSGEAVLGQLCSNLLFEGPPCEAICCKTLGGRAPASSAASGVRGARSDAEAHTDGHRRCDLIGGNPGPSQRRHRGRECRRRDGTCHTRNTVGVAEGVKRQHGEFHQWSFAPDIDVVDGVVGGIGI